MGLRKNILKEALKQGQCQYGCGFGQLRSQEVIKLLAAAGFHWAFVDCEHGGFDLETVQDLLRIAPFVNFTPLVRVADLQYSLVARALDVGAMGVIFPRVESPELLAQAISWTKFPPLGVRGYGLTPVNYDYAAVSIPQAIAHYNEETMVVLQIETETAVANLDALLDVPGIDVVMIGPADLSVSLGVPGEFTHPKFVAAYEKIRDACLKRGIAPGTHNRSLELMQMWKEKGFTFLGCANETAMLFERASAIIKGIASAPGPVA
ncbi:HpcH/HpaI aldolase family protein [Bryobacter aggregatus]|uniref:HpcH/HpaI aldolase family protein n=1 Tax=Bryobacter aggregatus TaxID=360054 RepID=UPI0004E27640|nr:aldolase/citrate lyase family protein [Bryobacter aggregatus]